MRKAVRDQFRFFRQGTFLFLLLFYIFYSQLIYSFGTERGAHVQLKDKASSQGKLVWQKYNCQACHQFYGLGGYLGPDLTNVYSAAGKGEGWIRAMLQLGPGSMPEFKLSDAELNSLIAFLKSVDQSGTFPRPDPKINWYGSFDFE